MTTNRVLAVAEGKNNGECQKVLHGTVSDIGGFQPDLSFALTAPIKIRAQRSRSAGTCPKHKIQICGLSEGVKVPIARDERNPLVDTALCNQCIAEAGLAALCKNLSTQRSSPLPIARLDLNERYF